MAAEQFITILKKERIDDLIPFLKSLTKDGKKEIASALKLIAKEYLEFKTVASLMGGSSFKQKATPRPGKYYLRRSIHLSESKRLSQTRCWLPSTAPKRSSR